MAYGFGRGSGRRFGFRSSSPPWPYVGLGRGGMPRCAYFISGVVDAPLAWSYQRPPYPFYRAGYPPFRPQTTKEELDLLKDEADAVKEQLEQIESRIRDLESESK